MDFGTICLRQNLKFCPGFRQDWGGLQAFLFIKISKRFYICASVQDHCPLSKVLSFPVQYFQEEEEEEGGERSKSFPFPSQIPPPSQYTVP